MSEMVINQPMCIHSGLARGEDGGPCAVRCGKCTSEPVANLDCDQQRALAGLGPITNCLDPDDVLEIAAMNWEDNPEYDNPIGASERRENPYSLPGGGMTEEAAGRENRRRLGIPEIPEIDESDVFSGKGNPDYASGHAEAWDHTPRRPSGGRAAPGTNADFDENDVLGLPTMNAEFVEVTDHVGRRWHVNPDQVQLVTDHSYGSGDQERYEVIVAGRPRTESFFVHASEVKKITGMPISSTLKSGTTGVPKEMLAGNVAFEDDILPTPVMTF